MNVDMTYKRKRALIAAQIVGFVFGLILGITGDYGAFWTTLGAAILAAVAFAVLLRFCVRAYQFGKVKFGVKVQDPSGGYAIIEKPGCGIFAAVVAFFLPVALISLFTNASQVLIIIYLFVLIAVGAFFCYLDIKYMVRHKREVKDSSNMP